MAPHLLPAETEALRRYLFGVLETRSGFPRAKASYDWGAVAMLAGIRVAHLVDIGAHVAPVLDAIGRSLLSRSAPRLRAPVRKAKPAPVPRQKPGKANLGRAAEAFLASPPPKPPPRAPTDAETLPAARPKRTYTKRPIEEFPAPLWTEWDDPEAFADALMLHIKRHGDSVRYLYRAIATGALMPRSIRSLDVPARIEHRYRLPAGYFKAKLPHPGQARIGHALDDFSPAERRRLAWHLPDDFNARAPEEQEEILTWVNRVVISGSTDYRAFQAAAIKNRYAVRFRAFQGGKYRVAPGSDEIDAEMRPSVIDAPPELERKMASLLRFKTSTLTQLGLQRTGVWATRPLPRRSSILAVRADPLYPGVREPGWGVPPHNRGDPAPDAGRADLSPAGG